MAFTALREQAELVRDMSDKVMAGDWGNLIAGAQRGMFLDNTHGNYIQGNWIGLDWIT